jgi:hypothetical protein
MRSYISHSVTLALVTVAACAAPRAEPVVGDAAHPKSETVALPIVGAPLAAAYDPFADGTGPAADDHATHAAHDHSAHAADDGRGAAGEAPRSDAAAYTCPMHPEVVQQGPGKCPKCGMALVPQKPKSEAPGE